MFCDGEVLMNLNNASEISEVECSISTVEAPPRHERPLSSMFVDQSLDYIIDPKEGSKSAENDCEYN